MRAPHRSGRRPSSGLRDPTCFFAGAKAVLAVDPPGEVEEEAGDAACVIDGGDLDAALTDAGIIPSPRSGENTKGSFEAAAASRDLCRHSAASPGE